MQDLKSEENELRPWIGNYMIKDWNAVESVMIWEYMSY